MFAEWHVSCDPFLSRSDRCLEGYRGSEGRLQEELEVIVQDRLQRRWGSGHGSKELVLDVRPPHAHSSVRVESASPTLDESSRSLSSSSAGVVAGMSSTDVVVDNDMLQQTINLTQKCSAESIGKQWCSE